MLNETYLHHPTFGLLFSLCLIEQNRALYTTLYAQRLFFIVNTAPGDLDFEVISRQEAKLMVEDRLRTLRRAGARPEYQQLQTVHQQTFL